MKTTRLTFSQLHQEMEVLERGSLRGIKGGNGDQGEVTAWLSQQYGVPIVSSYDEEGNWMVSIDGGPLRRLVFRLDSVEIIGTTTSFIKPGQFGFGQNPFGIDVWTSSSGNGSNTNNGGGGSSTSGNPTELFNNFLEATGTTVNAFGGVMADVHSIAKVGDFAADAKALLKSISSYSGALGNTIDVITTTIESFKDGTITVDEAAAFIANFVVGFGLGAIPFAGGVVATIYDLSGADDYVKDQIKLLIQNHFSNYVLIS